MQSRILGTLATLTLTCAGCAPAEANVGTSLGGYPHRAVASNTTTVVTDAAPAQGSTEPSEPAVCVGVPPAEADRGPIPDPADIMDVAPLRETVVQLKASWTVLRGVRIGVVARPGVTKQWLTRLAVCHAARHTPSASSLGESADPFLAGPLTVVVSDTPTGFVLTLRADSEALAEQVLARAERLAGAAHLPK